MARGVPPDRSPDAPAAAPARLGSSGRPELDTAGVQDLAATLHAAIEGLRHQVLQVLEGLPADPALALGARGALRRLRSLLAVAGGEDVGPGLLLPPDIVIVDDDGSCRLLVDAVLVAMLLENPRVALRDGDAAFAFLDGGVRTGQPPPALVILDSEMPGRSGVELLRWMRSTPELASVPVIMLTGTSDVASIRAAYDQDVASYLVKPVAYDALADVIRGLDRRWALL